MIRVTGFKWVPPFAQGQVRDLRARWVLEEAGWPYDVRLIDAEKQRSPEYRAEQPFGQVPVVAFEDRVLFESGAVVHHVATRADGLWPVDAGGQARALSWLFAALNSVEPVLQAVAEVDFFTRDEEVQRVRRPGVMRAAARRLAQAEAAFGEGDYVAGAFSGADVVLATVLRIVRHTKLMAACPRLAAYRDRCEARPAFVRALAGQMDGFARHGPADMKYPPAAVAARER